MIKQNGALALLVLALAAFGCGGDDNDDAMNNAGAAGSGGEAGGEPLRRLAANAAACARRDNAYCRVRLRCDRDSSVRLTEVDSSESARVRRRSARRPPRPDAERYVHTARDLMFPMGDTAVGIGSHS